jgi:hypothetical protein
MVRVSKGNQCKIWHKKAVFGAKSNDIGHTKNSSGSQTCQLFLKWFFVLGG